MKTRTTLPLMAVLSALSFGAFAADPISLQQAQDSQPMGNVSISGIDGVPSDIHQALNQAAAAKDARTYHVTEAYEHSNWHATAQLYKSSVNRNRDGCPRQRLAEQHHQVACFLASLCNVSCCETLSVTQIILRRPSVNPVSGINPSRFDDSLIV